MTNGGEIFVFILISGNMGTVKSKKKRWVYPKHINNFCCVCTFSDYTCCSYCIFGIIALKKDAKKSNKKTPGAEGGRPKSESIDSIEEEYIIEQVHTLHTSISQYMSHSHQYLIFRLSEDE